MIHPFHLMSQINFGTMIEFNKLKVIQIILLWKSTSWYGICNISTLHAISYDPESGHNSAIGTE